MKKIEIELARSEGSADHSVCLTIFENDGQDSDESKVPSWNTVQGSKFGTERIDALLESVGAILAKDRNEGAITNATVILDAARIEVDLQREDAGAYLMALLKPVCIQWLARADPLALAATTIERRL